MGVPVRTRMFDPDSAISDTERLTVKRENMLFLELLLRQRMV